MIPSDLAARLRLLTESTVNPVSAVHEIPADLPELAVGQRFTARIESALPDGTFRALVAGRSLTLALPQAATPGDTLELVVAARNPRLVVAEQAPDDAARSTPPATLSRAGQIISTLLAGDEAAPQPATITRAAPLLPAPEAPAARIAAVLQQALAESGLFYESHQAQWVAGRYPTEALAREPQARHARAQRPAEAAASPKVALPEFAQSDRASVSAGTDAARTPAAPEIPEALQPLVHQQLNAAATGHILWQGQIWPGQDMRWEIEAEREPRHRPDGIEEAEAWKTTLGLTLPRLGSVQVALTLTQAKVSLSVTADAGSAAVLRQGLGELAAAFAAAGLPPLAAGVEAHEPA